MLQQTEMKNFDQRFNELLQERLKDNFMPEDQIDFSLMEMAVNVLDFASPIMLGIPAEEYRDLKGLLPALGNHEKPAISLYQYAILSNNLERRTPKELDIYMDFYIEIIMKLNTGSDKWNEIVKIHSDEIKKELEEEAEYMKRVMTAEKSVEMGKNVVAQLEKQLTELNDKTPSLRNHMIASHKLKIDEKTRQIEKAKRELEDEEMGLQVILDEKNKPGGMHAVE